VTGRRTCCQPAYATDALRGRRNAVGSRSTCGGMKEGRARSTILTTVRGFSSQIFVVVVVEIRPVITLTRVRGFLPGVAELHSHPVSQSVSQSSNR
jgi:hypothetical protein